MTWLLPIVKESSETDDVPLVLDELHSHFDTVDHLFMLIGCLAPTQTLRLLLKVAFLDRLPCTDSSLL